MIKLMPIKFREYNDWTYAACDYSNSIRIGVMVVGGFELSVL